MPAFHNHSNCYYIFCKKKKPLFVQTPYWNKCLLVSSSLSSSLGSRYVPWLGKGLSMPSPSHSVFCCPLPYRVAPVFVQVISPPFGWSPLSSCLVIWSPSGDRRGPSVVCEAVDMPCPGPFHFSNSVDYIYDFCHLPDPDVGLSILVCDVEHTSYFFGLCGRKFVMCLFGQYPVLCSPYVIASSTYELYTCLFRQMARLLLKIPRCLAYAAQPAMIIRCISLSWLFSLRL